MKTFKERAEELAKNCNKVKNNNVYQCLSKEYSITLREAGDRFKSIFRMPVRDYISLNLIPTKEKLIDCLIQSDNWNEFVILTKCNNLPLLNSLLNTHFNTSNYFKIKIKILSEKKTVAYNVTVKDNESILISQMLGDGSIERNCSFKIEHGYKQYEYLKFKITLLNKAYPNTNTIGHIKKRIQNSGYVSYTYRTGQVLHKQLQKLQALTQKQLVNALTPFGVMLYFLDDGYFTQNCKNDTWELGFSTINSELQKNLIDYFKTYGYEFNFNKRSVTLKRKGDIISFIKDFIEPFENIIPESMYYKFKLKDIVDNYLLN